jgi:hypothetical protein
VHGLRQGETGTFIERYCVGLLRFLDEIKYTGPLNVGWVLKFKHMLCEKEM